MKKQTIILWAIVIQFIISIKVSKTQSVDDHQYPFAISTLYGRCNYFSFKFNGIEQFNFGRHFSDEIGCIIDSFHACQIYTPSMAYLPNQYFDVNAYPKEKDFLIREFIRLSIIQADSLNKYLKKLSNFNTLAIQIQNLRFSDSVISHLCIGISSIDSLIFQAPYNNVEFDSSKAIIIPMEGQYYQSVKYLKIESSCHVRIPDYIFETKTRPLETLVFVCDSIGDLGKLPQLKSLKKLTFVNTRNMDAIMPLILKMESLEELYIADTDLRRLPPELLAMPTLKKLVVYHNIKLSKFPRNIEDYRNLKYLTFSCRGNRKARKFSDKVLMLFITDPEKYNSY